MSHRGVGGRGGRGCQLVLFPQLAFCSFITTALDMTSAGCAICPSLGFLILPKDSFFSVEASSYLLLIFYLLVSLRTDSQVSGSFPESFSSVS